MQSQPNNKELGFAPIDQSEVFALSPKLEQLCKDLGAIELTFKTPENTSVIPQEGQQLIQGTMTMPQSDELVDFEMAVSYLCNHGTLLTIPRVDGSEVWGDTAAEPEFKDISTPTQLKEGLTEAISNAPSTLNLTNSEELKNAQIGLDKRIEQTQKIQQRNQPAIEHPPQEMIAKFKGR
jgi:hypothetical protein